MRRTLLAGILCGLWFCGLIRAGEVGGEKDKSARAETTAKDNAEKPVIERGPGGLPFMVKIEADGEPVPVGVGCRAFTTREPAADETAIDKLPFVIEKPGKYILTKDLECEASGIAVKANDVSLDLNGHAITYGTGVVNER